MKEIVYISGQMTGVENFNFPEFYRVETLLRNKGYEVINPADFGANPEFTWEEYMKRDIEAMMRANAIALLDGWEKSRGANLEVYIAKQLGYRIGMYYEYK